MKKHNGFTIVELLIVIVVIGILAGITIVAFNGVRARAVDSGIQSDLKSNSVRMQRYYADKGVWTDIYQEFTNEAPAEYAFTVSDKSSYTTLSLCTFGGYGQVIQQMGLIGQSSASGKYFAFATGSSSVKDITEAVESNAESIPLCAKAASEFGFSGGQRFGLSTGSLITYIDES